MFRQRATKEPRSPRRRRFWRRRRNVPFTEGNRVQLLVDGGAYFEAFLECVASAQHYIFVEAYILASDETGWRIARGLEERARAGVEVAVCYDGYGSMSLSAAYVGFLTAAGIKTLRFLPVSLMRGIWPWSKRNHRKVLVVDGRYALVGGLNISNDYAAEKDGGRGWHDMAVKVEGPATRHMEHLFRRLWRRFGGAPLTSHPRKVTERIGQERVRFLGNFARRDRSFIRRAYLAAIVKAERTIRISNAYFVPDRVLRRALIRASRRGVLVQIIVAGATDVPIVLWAARRYYSRFLRNNVEIYEYHERILHAKAAVIDGSWVTIGSSNLDDMSSFRNLEVNAGILSPSIGAQMDAIFEADLAASRRIDRRRWMKRSIVRRIVEWFFGKFRRVY